MLNNRKTMRAFLKKLFSVDDCLTLDKMFSCLSDNERIVINFLYNPKFHKTTYDIALELNYSEDNIKKIRHSALVKLCNEVKNG
jgi:DNA-directed RNA polymerase sigma subunit (sigma70/sigma32)